MQQDRREIFKAFREISMT